MAFDFSTPSRLTPSGAAGVRPWLLRIALLVVAVFMVHMAILNSASLRLNFQPSMSATAFSTRTIESAPAAPVLDSSPRVHPVARPPMKRSVTKPPRPTPPAPAPVLAPASDTPVTAIETPVAPVPDMPASTLDEATAAPDSPAQAMPSPPDTGVDVAPIDSSGSGQAPAAFKALGSARHLYTVVFTKNSHTNRGKAELTWRQDGGNYVLDLSASYFSIAVFQWNSTGQLASQGLLPSRFSDKRFRKSEVAAHFNHELGKVTFSANTPDAALLAGAQDRVSVILQIAGLLAADPARYPPSSSFSLQTVSATEAQPWLFTVNESETLSLPAGPQLALRITRNPRSEYDQKVELWFAPALNHLLVRFRFTETNGDFVDAQLQSSQSLSDIKSP